MWGFHHYGTQFVTFLANGIIDIKKANLSDSTGGTGNLYICEGTIMLNDKDRF